MTEPLEPDEDVARRPETLGEATGRARPGPSNAHDDYPFGESFESREDLELLAEQEGLRGVRVAAELIEDELHAKSSTRRVAEISVALTIMVLIFVRIIPKMFDVEYRSVWTELASISPAQLLGLIGLWCFTMWSYAGVLAGSLPGLKRMQAIVVNFSGSALANVIPFGGAAGVGATYAQCLSWGLEVPAITLSIVVTGVWNVFAKLGLPVIVLAMLVAAGRSSNGLTAAALIGLAALAASITVFSAIITSERVATSIGTVAQRAGTVTFKVLRRPAPAGIAGKVLGFRDRSAALIERRWRPLTLWMASYKLSQGLLLVACARVVGIDMSWIELLAVYAFSELLTTIPITPSGVGFVEVGAAGLLVSFGASNESALAAVLLYRTFTYLFEIPLGAIGWLTWATMHRWRRPHP